MGKQQKRPREVELKLELPSARADRIRKHPLLRGLRCRKRKMEARYFDTPSFDLSRSGFSLRVRSDGDRFVQTMKQTAGMAGIFDRNEWESNVDGFWPNFESLQHTPLRHRRKLLRHVELVGRSAIERTSWNLERDRCAVEVALDLGRIEAGRRHESIAELELELKDGDTAFLFELAEQLAECVPLRIGVLSKAQRVEILARAKGGQAIKAGKIVLDPESNVARAFSLIAHSCVLHFRLNEELIVERCDAAALHQGRVSMRRLRAALSVFGKAIADSRLPDLKRELRWFTSSLSDGRDIDVFLKRYNDRLSRSDRRKLLSARVAAYAAAHRSIDSDRFRTFVLSFLKWVETGSWRRSRKARSAVKPFAARRLERQWRKVQAGGLALTSLDEEQQHRFRIEVKKMRYATEFLSSLFDPGKVQTFVKTLEAMQECLGDLNDLVTARQLIEVHSLDFDLGDRPTRPKELSKTVKAFARLDRTGGFWAEARRR
ncbi:MAG: CHAD domain-containing protein [Alphaproteobacteria bacterium]